MEKKMQAIITLSFITIISITAWLLNHNQNKDVQQMTSKFDLKKKLTPLQYEVTQKGGTEQAFNNKYWNHKEKGIYVDLISRVPLFLSIDKYDSGSGWPSFTKTLKKDDLDFLEDDSYGMSRIEVKGKQSKSHLGHIFDDGPLPEGKRYCINSAALDFIPYDQLEKEGLAEYKKYFNQDNSDQNDKKLNKENYEVAMFAGGCFWCVQETFDKLPGVVKTIAGYSGGEHKNPSYEDVISGLTKHVEVLQVFFDPKKVSYEDLLYTFWYNIDPTVKNRQFCDVGYQYRTVVFYYSERQKELALKTQAKILESLTLKKIETSIEKSKQFYAAEDYHQDYYKKNPVRYKAYKKSCGRDKRLEQLWKNKKK